jgi:hypothetical protein
MYCTFFEFEIGNARASVAKTLTPLCGSSCQSWEQREKEIQVWFLKMRAWIDHCIWRFKAFAWGFGKNCTLRKFDLSKSQFPIQFVSHSTNSSDVIVADSLSPLCHQNHLLISSSTIKRNGINSTIAIALTTRPPSPSWGVRTTQLFLCRDYSALNPWVDLLDQYLRKKRKP